MVVDRASGVALFAALAASLGFLSAPPAGALLLGTDAVGNDQPLPGFEEYNYVGVVNGASGTYLGDGWVLTANHVGAADFQLGGALYALIPGSARRLVTSPGVYADLLMFQVYPTPQLSPFPIRATSPNIGDLVVMIGNGVDRGAATSFDPFGPEVAPPNLTGWYWGSTKNIRWGLNAVNDFPIYPVLGTVTFRTRFDESLDATFFECQATKGDSGGAVLIYNPAIGTELAGVMLSVTLEYGQAAQSSLFTNQTIIASLDVYRDQILDTMAVPEPTEALGPALALLSLLARRRAAS